MSDEFRIRKATVEDLAGMIALERTIPEAPHWTEVEYEAAVKTQDGGIRRCLLVAVENVSLLGFAVGKAIVTEQGSFAELESVAVDVPARRFGVGKALCTAVVAWSREQGASVLELEVRAMSAGAIALYEGLGFVSTGRRAVYYHDPVDDAVLMSLKL